ncbi:LysR [Vibrio nigripulchritudo ATCC 27043]|uniref:Putative Transcriptional regulator, LysR family n=1 Tax=Vibrio nigripulchritudo TaxID=28173 RepID=U4KCL1_9VIBR|nr:MULTISPECIES: LysR family transcriptional regulator [Vibrio]EGU60310.1 LysR [Vibrio nigripulchritudo ATCC 27043]UAB74001.1 LysR family transcriptional regulator [Vibrio sp. SCSIO 43132]CCN70776.1 putative Transcriptional regulator, LysR family [Vibrio nigripulchritudo SFn118]CCN84412.1 putative Transcriptional regulator, LysR family [Vibrio nigripulchritudo BLFn1]CCN86461.1 putative Transcriptional regulator, LysR family [Vibrio nigripulchritudo SFn27]
MDKNLQTFLMVSETLNVTQAAERLHITQPTLTKRLQQLEEQYGCKLFERLPRGVQLTEFGTHLLPYARRIEQDYLHANETVHLLANGHLDEVKIGAGPLFHLRYLAPAFDQLQKEFPNTRIHLTAGVNASNLPKVKNGSQDIMFGTREYLEDDEQVVFFPLLEVEQGIVIRSDHPMLETKDALDAKDLCELPWIVYSDTPENELMVRSYFHSRGLPPPRIVLQTTSFHLGFDLVKRGDYVMPVPFQLKPVIDSKSLHIFHPNPPIVKKPAGAFIRQSSTHAPIITRLIDIVRELIDTTEK